MYGLDEDNAFQRKEVANYNDCLYHGSRVTFDHYHYLKSTYLAISLPLFTNFTWIKCKEYFIVLQSGVQPSLIP